MTVKEPYWVELEDEADIASLEDEILYYIRGGSSNQQQFRFPKMLVVVLGDENLYQRYKQLFRQYQIPSQVVTARTGNKFNLSKASNVLKQINSKMGGDLFNIKLPDKLTSPNMRAMLIGIDVCHAGGNSSVVGFAASVNRELSQYYSDFIVQRKGQEVVNSQLKDCIKRALEVFAKNHGNSLPTDIIIYRDGVSAAERSHVVSREISQFTQAFNETYNAASTRPKINLLIVNKRIIQSFFVVDGHGRLSNPPSGSIIDRDVVETKQTKLSNEFDFFLVPVYGTQGCMRPTHFFVPLAQSNLTRSELQTLTYSLCHYYFNWAGPIKVPAPCMYAHKIADLFTRIGGGSTKKRQKQVYECDLSEVSQSVRDFIES